MKKFILILISVIVIVTISLVYSFMNDKKSDKTKITVAEVTHSVFYAPWYVALEKGYFEELGLDVEVILTPGADKVAASVLSGDAQIGFSGPEATVYVYNNSKEKLLTFASLTKRDGQFIVGDCSLKNNFRIEDLKGKKVLAGRSGGMPLMMFKYALKESGISESSLTIDTSIEFAGLAGAYIGGQGDFVNLFEPNALKIEQSKTGCVLSSLGGISGVVPYTAYYSKESYINSNEDIIKNFNKALNKGLSFVHNNDSKTIAEIIIKQFLDTSLNDLTILVERYKEADSWYETTYVNNTDYDRLLNILLYGKTIDKVFDSKILITNEFN